jgi:hypothetical protein
LVSSFYACSAQDSSYCYTHYCTSLSTRCIVSISLVAQVTSLVHSVEFVIQVGRLMKRQSECSAEGATTRGGGDVSSGQCQGLWPSWGAALGVAPRSAATAGQLASAGLSRHGQHSRSRPPGAGAVWSLMTCSFPKLASISFPVVERLHRPGTWEFGW